MSPDQLALRLQVGNWIAARRALSGESLFLVAAMTAFGAIALVVIIQPLAHLKARVDQLPDWLAVALAALVGLVSASTVLRNSIRLTRHQASDWLCALPITQAQRMQFRRQHALRLGLVAALPGFLLLAFLGWPSPVLPLVALSAYSPGAWLALAYTPRARRGVPRRSAAQVRDATGLNILGASLEPASARWPHTARFAAASLLLVPMGSGPLLVIALLLTATCLRAWLDLMAHYSERLTESAAWLSAQPLQPVRLLWCFMPTLLRRSALLMAVPLLGIALSPAPLALLPAAAAATLSTVHAILLIHVERWHPVRRQTMAAVHLIALVLFAQIWLPIAFLAWAIFILLLWRRRHV